MEKNNKDISRFLKQFFYLYFLYPKIQDAEYGHNFSACLNKLYL